MKTTRRILIENFIALALGGLAFWPLIEVLMRAGPWWGLLSFLTTLCWAAFMGYTVKGR